MQESTKNIVALLSHDRFEACRYRGEDDESTLRRVVWNTALSEALYTPLQGLEVAVRNSVHGAISNLYGSPDWILKPISTLRPSEQQMMRDAIEFLRVRGKPLTAGHMISELKFGFWTSLFDSHYEKLWHQIIKAAFPAMPKVIRTRGELSRRINPVRHLRNAVSHHHSIWHWRDLKKQHEEIYVLLAWMEPAFAEFIRNQDRFPVVLAKGS